MNQILLILLLLAVCAGVYFREQQPKDWNDFLNSLKAPAVAGAAPEPGTGPDTTNAAPAAPAAPYIVPSTAIYTNSGHVKDVSQPAPARVFVPPNPLPAQSAWIWTTADGRTFKNVVIEKVEADRVTIFHDQGSAVIDIDLLPDDIQKQLNYDSQLAAQASSARAAAANPAAPVPAPAPQ